MASVMPPASAAATAAAAIRDLTLTRGIFMIALLPSFHSGCAGQVEVAGDPRRLLPSAGELLVPAGSYAGRNRAGNGCSPVMNGKLAVTGQVRQVIATRGSGA